MMTVKSTTVHFSAIVVQAYTQSASRSRARLAYTV
jgi:hypothetical protein